MSFASKESEKRFIREFLQLYRSLPALWLVKSAMYKDKKKKNASYKILLAKYRERYSDATKDDIRKKINSLRSNFRKETRKFEKIQAEGEEYVPTLWYYNDLLFLIESHSFENEEELENSYKASNSPSAYEDMEEADSPSMDVGILRIYVVYK